MRILLACEFYYPSAGGVQEVMRQIAERLVEHGHQVTVATTFLAAREARTLNGVNIKEFRVSGNLAHGIRGEADAYRSYVLEGNYDVFMVKAAQQWTFDALSPVFDRMSRPKIFVPCGFSGLYDPAYSQYFRDMPDMLRKFDHLIFYATDYRDINLAREHGIENFTIVPNGASEREFLVPLDSGFRQRHGISKDAFLVLTVGSITGQKGHRELAEAFALAQFGERPAALILNGNQPTPPHWQHPFAGLAGDAAVLFRLEGALRVLRWLVRPLLLRARLLKAFGYRGEPSIEQCIARINRSAPRKYIMIKDLARSELIQAYLNSDLFVFASNIEYSPLVLYEAAAAGLPFLSVAVGNAEEIAQWTGGGEICPALRDGQGYTRVDPKVLAERILILASNPDKLKDYGAAGRRNWLERFTWEKIVDRYEDIFEQVLCEREGNAGAH